MTQRKLRGALAVIVLWSAGCAVRAPMVWRIEAQTLTPPGKPAPVALRTRGECPTSPAIAVRRKGDRAVLTIDRAALSAQPAGWLAEWSRQAEEQGCVPAGAGAALAGRVLESTPMVLGAGFRLLHPSAGRSGYVDLGPGARLEMITPVFEPAAPPAGPEPAPKVTEMPGGLQVEIRAPAGLARVEKSWYAVREGAIEPIGTVRDPGFFARVQARFWRLIYKADESTVIVGADSLAEMRSMTATAASGAACAKCIAVPRAIGLNPLQAVMVNGSEVRVPMGSTLRAVIRAAGKKPEEVLPTLAIRKGFGGRMLPVEFERTKPDVWDLVMEGNETVNW